VIRSSLLDRSALEDSLAIYYIFSEFCTIYYEFWNLNEFPRVFKPKYIL
jgi:hypothetical protein